MFHASAFYRNFSGIIKYGNGFCSIFQVKFAYKHLLKGSCFFAAAAAAAE